MKEAIYAEVEAKTGHRPDEANDRSTFAGMHYRSHPLGKDPAFEQTSLLEKPLALVKNLLNDTRIFSTVGSHFREQEGHELALHSDMSSWLPVTYPHQAMFANCTLALTDYTRESGALAVVPRSHKKCRAPEETGKHLGDNVYAIPVKVPAGGAVISRANLWHGNYVREAPGYRINLAMAFCAQD